MLPVVTHSATYAADNKASSPTAFVGLGNVVHTYLFSAGGNDHHPSLQEGDHLLIRIFQLFFLGSLFFKARQMSWLEDRGCRIGGGHATAALKSDRNRNAEEDSSCWLEFTQFKGASQLSSPLPNPFSWAQQNRKVVKPGNFSLIEAVTTWSRQTAGFIEQASEQFLFSTFSDPNLTSSLFLLQHQGPYTDPSTGLTLIFLKDELRIFFSCLLRMYKHTPMRSCASLISQAMSICICSPWIKNWCPDD